MANFKNKVVYQIYPKSFCDFDGDGEGDLKGVTSKLDYLQDLGVELLWSTPFFPSPQRDNGYDVSNYCAVDARFGTMDDLEELIAEADKRNIGLMFDMVFNHTSTEHEWFQKALAGDEKYQNYYIFKDGTPDEIPTNWVSKFGGPAWEYVPSLGKWYLRLFDVTQADLNWENPEVREELKNVLRFWKAKGIKGFRFDVVNLISKTEIFENDYIGDGRRFYTDGRHVHEFLKEMVRDTGIEDMTTVGEMSSTSLDNCVRYTSPKEKELSMCFSFHHLKVDYKDGDKWSLMPADLQKLKDLFCTWQEGMQAEDGWNAVFWCNHDQPRAVSRFGNEDKYWKESAKMLAAAIHLMRGTPYIYQGEELGMTNHHYTAIEQYWDVESLNYYRILMENGKTSEEALQILAERSRDNCGLTSAWRWSSNYKKEGNDMGLFDKLFAKKEEINPNHIFAPLAGQVVPVSEVPDPTFAQGFPGEGVAIIPSDGKVYAPCNATVGTMFDTGHAISLEAENGADILIHVGLETVGLGGKCFKAHVKNGQKVKKGQLLFEADLENIKAAGLNTITPVLVCNMDDFASLDSHTGNVVTTSDVVIELSK